MWQGIKGFLAFLSNHFKGLLFLLIVYVLFAPSSCSSPGAPANLAKVKLNGPLMQAESYIKQFEELKEDASIKGVLFEIDSPGGIVPPSIEIAYAIQELVKVKPVVAYASGSMTSGSYYAGIYASHIVANPGSMIGSIGVILQGANVEALLESIGISEQVAKAGEYKEMGTLTREWSQKEKEGLQKVIDDTYQLFVADVAKARGLEVKEHKRFADAKVFLAAEAKEVGLIDTVGTKQVAIARLQGLSGIQKPIWKERDKFELMMERMSHEASSFLRAFFSTKLQAISSIE